MIDKDIIVNMKVSKSSKDTLDQIRNENYAAEQINMKYVQHMIHK